MWRIQSGQVSKLATLTYRPLRHILCRTPRATSLENRVFQGRPEMAFSTRREELSAEIPEIRKLQMESNRQATFGGWTREAEAAHEMRADRIAALLRELAVVE
jgi:hypothetical protein